MTTIKDFGKIFRSNPTLQELCRRVTEGGRRRHIALDGLNASAVSLATATLFDEKCCNNILVIADDADKAGYLYFDLTQLIGSDRVAFFPALYKHIHKSGATIAENGILRTDSLNKISDGKPCIIVSYPDAISEKVVAADRFASARITLTKGQEYAMSTLLDDLRNSGFDEVDFVYEVGQYSQRGSIVDVFSYSNELPYRIDFFGDTVESIRTFDIERQLSIEEVDRLAVVAATDSEEQGKVSLLEFVAPDTLIVANDIDYCIKRIDQIYSQALVKANEQRPTSDLYSSLIDGDGFRQQLEAFFTVEVLRNFYKADTLVFATTLQPNFNKNFDLISKNIKQYLADGYRIYIASDSKKQIDRITSIFDDRGDDISFEAVDKTLHEGFVDNDLKVCFFTDHQIFDRFHRFSLKSDTARRGKAAMLIKELNSLKPGDFVVHHDHGVGQFAGLLTTNINGKPQEVIKLIYKGGDIIFVNISSLHKISKYRGKEGVDPMLSKLGTGAWERLKERTKTKVKDIARDLIRLYAKRLEQKGFCFSPDSYMQTELEASFTYEDTPDQSRATADIKNDMQSHKPMDRLVCGDVGFGKTEVAIRAAFKAVADGKQVAVLVPTTILAFQHYKTFSERLKNYPVRIEYLSRAKTAKQTKEIVSDIKEGKIDIVIGTHKIANKKVVFKDLGLLIIDEEQKFGVAIKERLKEFKANVDTLTLTATPIPRTLQFSLMGARDLSIINTPPPNRYPVVTELIEFDEETIGEAIRFEMQRNGQIFFVNDKIQNIYLLEKKLKKIVPEARIAVAHGQMPSAQLEETVIDFIDYQYDILLATTVIESGIDMPNVNTIFVNNANHFGLSDLHQLRGRVGRSNRKAYCYLITPTFKDISEDARRRLQAISTFSDLGSGFNIAMQDLDIRGAGNMLGAEQSGFIAELGYETYQKILAEAVQELHRDEFADIVDERQQLQKARFVDDCTFESDFELMFPNSYISSTSERISLYRELDSITEQTTLDAFKARLIDRFGAIPQEAEELMKVLPVRWLAIELGIERLIVRRGKMTLYLVSRPDSEYYKSDTFGKIIGYIGRFPRNCRIGETGGKRFVSVEPVNSIDTVLYILNKINDIEP